jgi:hypothetical protein
MKLKFLLFTILGLAFLTFNIGAQTKRTTTKPKTTKPVKTPITQIQQGTLSIETGLVFDTGEVVRVARTQFYLLDKDLKDVLTEAGFTDATTGNATSDAVAGRESQIEQYASLQGRKKRFGTIKDELTKAEEAIKQHSIATMTTDFDGKGSFAAIKTGQYFLFGFTFIDDWVLVWNVSVDLKTGSQSLTLDQNNVAGKAIWRQ